MTTSARAARLLPLALPVALAVAIPLATATPAVGDPALTQTEVVGPGGLVTAAEGASYHHVTPDGRFVLFRSRDSLLPHVSDAASQVPGQDFDLSFFCYEPPDVPESDCYGPDLFLLDTNATPEATDDTLELVSVDSDELGGGFDAVATDISPDGNHIVLHGGGSDLVADDTIAGNDVFLRNRVDGTTTRVSVKPDGSQATYLPPGNNNDSRDASVSDDGRVVAFRSTNRSLAPETPVPGDTWQQYDIYVRDMRATDPAAHTTKRLTAGFDGAKADASSEAPVLTGDGRYAYFTSRASNLVPGDTNAQPDLFRYDLDTDTLTRVWENPTTGVSGEDTAWLGLSGLTPDSRYALLSGLGLTTGDTDAQRDVFRLDVTTGALVLVSAPVSGVTDGGSSGSTLSADGRYAAFSSSATNMVVGDTNAREDVFRRDLSTGSTIRVSLEPGGGQRNGAIFGAVMTGDGGQILYIHQQALVDPFTDPAVNRMWRAEIAAEPAGPVYVLPEPSLVPLMTALAAEVTGLELATLTGPAYSVPSCPAVPADQPLPAGRGDYLALIGGDPYTAAGGLAAPAVQPGCLPDAVTVYAD